MLDICCVSLELDELKSQSWSLHLPGAGAQTSSANGMFGAVCLRRRPVTKLVVGFSTAFR